MSYVIGYSKWLRDLRARQRRARIERAAVTALMWGVFIVGLAVWFWFVFLIWDRGT